MSLRRIKKTKIALVTNFATHYRYPLFNLLSEFSKFDLYFFDDPARTKEDIEHLKIFKNEFSSCYHGLAGILKAIIEKRYEIIIKCTNNKWSFIGSFLVAKLIRAKFIVWHSIWYYPRTAQYRFFSRLFVKILKDYADAILVYGEHGRRFLINNRVSPKKIFVAWQTVDNRLYGRSVGRGELAVTSSALGISARKKIELYVGRFVVQKGICYLLRALGMLDKTKFVFVAIGDGNLKHQIRNYCDINQIEYRLLGIVPYSNLVYYYKLATLLVLPSVTTRTFKEPWGLVVNEAFNQGCPVVVTDAVGAGVGGLVKNGENGLVIPERNVDALAGAIDMILSDTNLRKAMSKNALEDIKSWTYDRQSKGFLDAIEYCLKM